MTKLMQHWNNVSNIKFPILKTHEKKLFKKKTILAYYANHKIMEPRGFYGASYYFRRTFRSKR